MSTIYVSETIPVNVPVQDLWHFLYDTDRLNRSVGLPTVSFVPDPDPSKKGHYAAEARLGPIRLKYEEFPFEWAENHYYRVLRRFPSGPFRQMVVGVRMSAVTPQSSSLELFADVTPRFAAASFLVKFLVRKRAIVGFKKQVKAFEEGFHLAGKFQVDLRPPAVLGSQLDARLGALTESLGSPALTNLLVEFIRNGSDTDVSHIRPFELADKWKENRNDVMRFLLHATKAGLVDLNWEVVCPHCKAAATTVANLSGVSAQAACTTCEESFRSDLSESIEAIFTVNPAIRVANRGSFCIGGPANMPRIIGQFRLEPGESRVESLVADEGLLTARCYQSPGIRSFRAEKNESSAALQVASTSPEFTISADRVTADVPLHISLTNRLDREALIVIEKDNWRDTAATASLVATIQEFRDLFPEQAVAPGQEIRVGRLAVLFTDLQGSTALYSEIGDVKAFDFVHGHFTFLTACIARNNGGLIKTIGDAVMAAFPSGREALTAAIEMQQGWDDFLKSQKLDVYIGLRVGLHEGSAVAFNNRGVLDYFGTTVNMAARVQAKSGEREVVISKALVDDVDAAQVLRASGLTIEPFSAELKGIVGSQPLARLLFTPS